MRTYEKLCTLSGSDKELTLFFYQEHSIPKGVCNQMIREKLVAS